MHDYYKVLNRNVQQQFAHAIIIIFDNVLKNFT